MAGNLTSQATSLHDIKTLMLSFHPVVVMETVEEDRVLSLLLSVAAQLTMPLFEWSVTRGLTRVEDSSAINRLTANPMALLQHLAGLRIVGIFCLKDFSRHLVEAAVVRQFRDLAEQFRKTRSTMVLTGATVELPPDIEPLVVRYQMQLPDGVEMEKLCTTVIESLGKSLTRDVHLSPQEREAFMGALRGLTLNQARQAIAAAVLNDGRLTGSDIQVVLQRKAQMIKEGGILEYYPTADNAYQLGGFANLKAWLERERVGFTQEARSLNLGAPRGILIVGVPGCGKSLAAKAIAREWKLPLLKLDAGRLLDKFIGESEKNFRKAIALAESMAPVVLWIDEVEKGMVATGGGEADAGLSRRLFGAFLTWLQEKRQEVFVVATANDLSLLPPELLRKGRFDEIFFVDLPDAREREEILKIHLTLRKQDPARFDLAQIVTACEGFSGAEIEQAVVAGLYRALSSKRPLNTDILLDEIGHTIPLSVSRREDIVQLRSLAKDRFVSVR